MCDYFARILVHTVFVQSCSLCDAFKISQHKRPLSFCHRRYTICYVRHYYCKIYETNALLKKSSLETCVCPRLANVDLTESAARPRADHIVPRIVGRGPVTHAAFNCAFKPTARLAWPPVGVRERKAGRRVILPHK